MSRRNALVAVVIASVAFTACSNSIAPAGQKNLVIEAITVDAAAVQAATPASDGNTAPGTVSGLLGYIEGSQPTRLVVLCHGYGHNVEDSWTQHVRSTVREDTAVVTTNYRDNLRFPTLRGAHDTIAATLLAKERFPTIDTVYLLGVSMGGAVSGTALTESVNVTADGSLLYHYWIDVEGVSNLAETWSEATAVGQTGNEFGLQAAADIEDDTGGTPATVPAEYNRRAPLQRVSEMGPLATGGGLRAVTVVHATYDGTVPYNQGQEMARASTDAGIPTQFFTVLRHAPGQNPGSVLPNTPSGFAGHGSEADPNHPVIRTGFEQLELMLDGTYDETLPYRECQVDDGDGSTVQTCTTP